MIGTYYRLSLADEDVGADKAESNSIQGQRGLVEGYIIPHWGQALERKNKLSKEFINKRVDSGTREKGVYKADLFADL